MPVPSVNSVSPSSCVCTGLLDDKPMAVRDKGPLFIIYPFDQHAELRNPVYYSRCAWQLKAIELL